MLDLTAGGGKPPDQQAQTGHHPHYIQPECRLCQAHPSAGWPHVVLPCSDLFNTQDLRHHLRGDRWQIAERIQQTVQPKVDPTMNLPDPVTVTFIVSSRSNR